MITVHEWESSTTGERCRYCGTAKPANAFPAGPPRFCPGARTAKLSEAESLRAVLKSIEDECDPSALAAAGGYIFRCVAEQTKRVRDLDYEVRDMRAKYADAMSLAAERLAHANQLQSDIEAEQSGRLTLRAKFGARDNETMGMFIARLAGERDAWKQEHENALACWRSDVTALAAARDAALAGEADAVRRAESSELGCEIAYRREPTQAEGDAHEHRHEQSMGASYPSGECFVPMGGWTGRRCRICSRWVWGGPTACVACVRVEEAQNKGGAM